MRLDDAIRVITEEFESTPTKDAVLVSSRAVETLKEHRLRFAALGAMKVAGDELVRVIDALQEENVLGEWPVVRAALKQLRKAIDAAEGREE